MATPNPVTIPTARSRVATGRATCLGTIALLLAAALLAGCEGEDRADADDGPHPLIGAWRTMSMEVYLDARDGRAGATRAIAVSGDEWEESLGLSPPERHFTEDGLYESIYRDAAGREVERNTGYWASEGDGRISLIQVEPETDRQQIRYTVRSDLMVEIETWVDWNSDGEADDLQISSQRRLRASETAERSR